jgi:hypothetical protein
MSDIKQLITEAIMNKGEIDRINRLGGTNMVSYDRWLIGAVELLLRVELERQTDSDNVKSALRQMHADQINSDGKS